MSDKIAIIDADSIIYIIGWRAKDLTINEQNIVIEDLKTYVTDMIYQMGVTRYLGVFSAKRTHRTSLAVTRPYKGNRPDSPEWLQLWKPIIIEYCIKEFGFVQAEGIEADDVLSIMRGDNVILASPDKDLKQIPGQHYDYTKQIYSTVTDEEADWNLHYQVLVGDTGDNIPGLPKCGKVGATKILTKARELGQSLWEATLFAYVNKFTIGDDDNGELWEYEGRPYFSEQYNLVKLLDPTEELVEHYSKFIQTVVQEDNEESLINSIS